VISRAPWIRRADERAAEAMHQAAAGRFLDGWHHRGLAWDAEQRGRAFLAVQGIHPRFPNPLADIRAGRGLLSRREARSLVNAAIKGTR
jgi:hypothetical protein